MNRAFATKNELFQPCEYPTCSFFDLIDSIWKGDKERSYPLHRFCTLMRKMNARSYVQEELIQNDELLEEKNMAEVFFGTEVKLDAARLTFFCAPHELLGWDNSVEQLEKYILGYAVIVTMVLPGNDFDVYLHEAVVRSPSIVFFEEKDKDTPFIEPVTNYYVHNVRKFATTIGTQELSKQLLIEGSFFCQQNGFTSSCAHAALRMAINSSPLLNAPKLTNKCINDILRDELGVDLKEQSGLDQEQIQAVVEKLGYGFHSANFLENTQIEYDQFIYPSLESCFPQILGIQGWNPKKSKHIAHVVAVLGHTINSDRWTPEARCGYGNYPIQPYISSASWCDHLIISDDNYGMYVTLPSEMLRNFIVPTKNPNLHATMAVSILPREITLRGYEVEQRAMVVADKLVHGVELDPPNVWHDRMKSKDLVSRTLLQTNKQYVSFIQQHNSSMTEKQETYFNNLPSYIWVTEVSLPNIYTGNKHKLGDVVTQASASKDQHKEGKSIVLAWFPGFIQLGATPQVDIWNIDTHVPLIRNTTRSFLEW